MGAFPDARINAGIDARLGATVYLSAHTAFSATGTNEVTGGSYARQLMAMDAAASRISDNTAAESIPIPAGTTVRWLGLWTAVTAGTFLGMIPNGSTVSKVCVGLNTGDIFHCASHGFTGLDPVTFLNIDGSLPTGLTEGTVYYAKTTGITTHTFQVTAAADDGTAVALTGDGSGIVSDIVEEVFGSAGTLELAAGALDVVGLA